MSSLRTGDARQVETTQTAPLRSGDGPNPAWPVDATVLFRFSVLVLCLGQMAVYYDTAQKTIPHINLYLLGNLALVLLALVPWRAGAGLLWALVWMAGALLRLDWATRPTNSDVFWATSQGVDFLLHGLNPYTQTYTWVYQHLPNTSNYPAYSYFPGGLFAEVPFFLLGNVRFGLALADLGTALLIFLIARERLGAWPARSLAAFWLLFVPLFAVPLLISVLDFFLLFWVALSVWLYGRGRLVLSGLAAAMVFATKQYGFLFAVPWGVLLALPLVLYLHDAWRSRRAQWWAGVPRRLWAPPAALVGFSALLVLPLALLSPKAFLDATVQFHAKQLPVGALGTPQWNESIAGQLAGLGWVRAEDAQPIAAALFALLVLGLLVVAAFKIRDQAAALMWSALVAGVSLAVNSGRVHFFYWRLPLLLFLLYFVLSGVRAARPGPADETLPNEQVS